MIQIEPFEVVLEESGSTFDISFASSDSFAVDFGEVTVIHEIPSNYGLITWNGLTLTVS